jgi:hypothetical protein
MTRRSRWLSASLACLLVAAVSCSAASAADRSKVDRATKRVEEGAKQIGRGDLAAGFKEMFAGIGHTIVEGAKYSGAEMGEFFERTFGS